MKRITNITYAAFALLAFACFALSPTVGAVDPPPDGGYPNGASAQSAPSPGPFVSAAARMIGTADVTPPQLVSVDFTPKSVDVSSSSQTITVTAHVTDDNSGVSYVQPLFSSPSGQQSATAGLTLVSGTAQDGIYQGIVTIPESAESGTWTMGQFWVGDVVGNSLSYPDSAQYPTGTPTQLVVSARLETERLNVQVVHGATHSVITDANLSGGAGTQLNATGKGQYVTYAVPVQDAGTYNVRVRVKTGPNAGIFRLSIDGTNQGQPQDEYTPTAGYSELDLGTVTFLTAGNKGFNFLVNGKNPNSGGYVLAFDYIELISTNRQETESLTVQSKTTGPAGVFNAPAASGGAGTYFNATAVDSYITYTVPVVAAGTYHVRVGVQTRSNKGIFQLSINGGNQGSPVDEYLPSLSYGMADLGTVTFLNPGDQSFTFTVKGKNAASTGYTLAFDYIELIPTSRQETESLNVQSKTTGPAGVFNAPAASNGAGTYFNATGVGNYITYTVPVVKAGTYHVRVGIQTRANKGMFQLAINGLNIGQPQDEYYPSITYVQRDLGLVSFSVGGNYAFKFTVTGKNASSSGYTLAFDYIELVEQSFFPLSFSTVDPNCDGDFFIGTFTNPFDRDALLQITGTVDDDLLVDGIVIQDGEFPFTDTAPNPCPGSGVLNGIHAITYLATVSTHQTVSISVRNNFRGYASINGTLVFQ